MILPDILANDLKVVFCGMAPGNVSAKAGAYYANNSNKFWEMLYKMGLTAKKMAAQDFRHVLAAGIGLTDMAKEQFGMDKVLKKQDFDRYYGLSSSADIQYGKQAETIGSTVVFVLPSPSPAAIRWWQESYWLEAGKYIKQQTLK